MTVELAYTQYKEALHAFGPYSRRTDKARCLYLATVDYFRVGTP